MAQDFDSPPRLWRVLAGLQAGVVAGLIMSAYLLFENLRTGRPAWHAAHLFAGALLGPRDFRPQFHAATVVGYALLLMGAGLHGLLFGLLVPPRVGMLWSANLGIPFAMFSYIAVFRGLLGHWNPLLLARGWRASMILAHFVFGAALAFYPRFYGHLAGLTTDEHR